ncbi:MAG: hypothetical protein OXG17_04195 [Chloroflexi bacterium]|nr:hypothetical protein [Chloroflexota bacterium]
MPIETIERQRKLRELGRIRLGERGPRGRPVRLDTFRFTSASRELIEQIAARFGGEIKPWQSQRGPEWEVVTEANEIEIVLPPRKYLEQWFELWVQSGLQRRCNGVTEQLTQSDCLCSDDPQERECKPTTYLWLILPGTKSVGTWRLMTGSWFAAGELAGVADLLALGSANNVMIPATLRIDPRMRMRDGKTNRYAVPVIDVKVDPSQLARGELPDEMRKVPQLGDGRRGTQRVPLGEAPKLPEDTAFEPPTIDAEFEQVDEIDQEMPAPAQHSATADAVTERGTPAQVSDSSTSDEVGKPDTSPPPEGWPWEAAAVPDKLQEAWQTWQAWVKGCDSTAAIDALAEHFEATYPPDDQVRKTISSMFYVEVRKRREDLG